MIQTTLRIKPYVYDQIARIANLENRSINKMICNILENYIKNINYYK